MSPAEVRSVVARTMTNIESHDSVWREFETIHLQYELKISASCFAQLKRHRMSTILAQDYDTALGVAVPQSVRASRSVGMFRAAIRRAETVYSKIRRRTGAGEASYILTNGHRRRVLIDINLRELYHFSRLRSDVHAQWEIREISDAMCLLARRKLPAGAMLLAGKDTFQKVKMKSGL
jgi:thymidylate synthase ThyX